MFIINNRDIFIKNMNWRRLSTALYSYGLVNIQRYWTLYNKDISLDNLAEEFLIEFVHKGPLWAIKLYIVLHTISDNPGHRYLISYINRSVEAHHKSELSKVNEVHSVHEIIDSSIYLMNKRPHGIALIINIETFIDTGPFANRIGSEHDVTSLIRVFDFIEYDTKVFVNLTRREFLKALRKIRDSDHSIFDSFFCVIMSHGNYKGEVIFADNKPLSKSKIMSEFSPRYCKGLESKPKIFLFQACRETINPTVNLQLEGEVNQVGLFDDQLIGSTEIEEKTTDTLMDTFIGDSTINQYLSFRFKTKGTIFIQSFCSVMQSCSNREFTHIMMEVRRKVSLDSNQLIQCTEDTSRLLGPVYF